MQVVKEVWLLKNTDLPQDFMCAQNTATPKLYVSENSAISSANYHAHNYTDINKVCYKPVKAYIVIEGAPNAI
jgi:hypothetical protein